MVQPYANLGGNSNVRAFEIGSTWIDVHFHNSDRVYRYSHGSCGPHHCEQLKARALAGQGLNSYIMHQVKYDYEK
jgi:hypothetical protein